MITASMCLAMALYYEARSEGHDGMLAVAEVVINRVIDPAFPNDVCSVVKQDKGPHRHDCQFSFYCDGKPERPREREAWEMAQHVAQEALAGNTLGHGATHYHTRDVRPHWAEHFEFVGSVGHHIFYVEKKPCRSHECAPRPKARPSNA